MAHVLLFADSGITLALYFWIDDVVEGRMEPRTQAHLAILKSFRENGIRMAVPAREMLPQK